MTTVRMDLPGLAQMSGRGRGRVSHARANGRIRPCSGTCIANGRVCGSGVDATYIAGCLPFVR
jgi:hypothetical protein